MKKCFDQPVVTINLTYETEYGDVHTRCDRVSIGDGILETIDVVKESVESFLRYIGEIHTNTVYFAEELTNEEYEAVTGILMEMREQLNEDRDCQD